MFRIGGNFNGIVASAETLRAIGLSSKGLPRGLAWSKVDRAVMDQLDALTSLPAGLVMEGFTFLSAGVISYLESQSSIGVIAYVERSWGLEIVDCAAAWNRGRLVAGPTGSAVHADDGESAFTEMLIALGIEPQFHAEVLRSIAEST